MVNETKQDNAPVAEIPDKLYFKIGEVAKLANLKTHVLRYWETEFPTIRPEKSKTNQRVYKRKDVETIFLIKKLLYEDKYTIEGARIKLKEARYKKSSKKAVEKPVKPSQQFELLPSNVEPVAATVDNSETITTLKSMRGQLNRMLDLLND